MGSVRDGIHIWMTGTLWKELFDLKRMAVFKREWAKAHRDSNMIPVNRFDPSLVSVGKASYGELYVLDSGKQHKLSIGDFVSVGHRVCFILDMEHAMDHISTFPFRKAWLGDEMPEATGKGDIIVGDDVWIGYGATILSGVRIGQGAVIAAGSVVTKDVPPYAVVGGVPADIIKYRFSWDLIKELERIDYQNLDREQVRKHLTELYRPLTDPVQLQWMPRK